MPTCSGNRPDGDDILCGAAVDSCPDPADIRFWKYQRVWDPASQSYGAWRQVGQAVCLGPGEEPSVDPVVTVVGTVRGEWKSYPIPAAQLVTEPRDSTLVNVATRLSTMTPPTVVLPPKTILGYRVTVTVKASGYVWDFGDGTTLAAPANGERPRTEHTYRSGGSVRPSLRVFYTGTFSVGGIAGTFDLPGTADVPGAAAALAVREARAQLEAGPEG